jgi:hypothetical protein
MSLEIDAEFGYCRSRLLPWVGLGAAMTLLSAVFAFGWLSSDRIDGGHRVIGDAGLTLFGLVTAISIFRTLFPARGPVVLVSRYGIRDFRIANEFILWDSVTDVSACEYRGRKFVVLRIAPALEQRLFCARAAKTVLAANRAAGLDGIVIRPDGLDTDFAALLATCRANYAAARDAGGPLQKDAVATAQAQWAAA